MASPAPPAAAEDDCLRYVTGEWPCIRRIRRGLSFRYLGLNGRPLHDAADLKRIRSLVIPPSWEEVWICPSANGACRPLAAAREGANSIAAIRVTGHQGEAKCSRMIAFETVRARMRARV